MQAQRLRVRNTTTLPELLCELDALDELLLSCHSAAAAAPAVLVGARTAVLVGARTAGSQSWGQRGRWRAHAAIPACGMAATSYSRRWARAATTSKVC